MLVFFEAGIVLLAVPKTGTTALEGALAPSASLVIRHPPVLKHAPWYRYNRFVRPMLEDIAGRRMTTHAVLREPVSWLGSWYRFRQRTDVDPGKSTQGIDFDAFVAGYLSDPKPSWAEIGSQKRFVSDRQGRVRVDRLWRYEDLDALIDELADRLQIERPRPKAKNVSPKIPLTLSPGMAARLRSERPEEFAIWEAAGSTDRGPIGSTPIRAGDRGPSRSGR